MNKNDVASIRKEFKLDNSRLKLADVVSIYVKGDNKQIIGTEKENFGRMAKSDKNQNLHGQLQKKGLPPTFIFKRLAASPFDHLTISALSFSFTIAF
ncbi:hypothetical protein Desdi_1622 [Desulfitobacterium dichloroeliminans LMG P-21439]|uniref:Uncharacterized protein n=1 Tax=Desulfitobacterium dichloroeliminans (strain LMG P-21439 / DCA1) TaxID=871963 RepID=L0F848_DESDL|nr:DUF4317 family protein [Desulfitobacterium dichloroeliminans]AGA69113.1 hypothetical protein Desdi_1622 [Desulfitobacterium dichloroeliminans LMG P-21439]